MSWWVIDTISVNENGDECLCDIQCDAAADLPAANQISTAGYTIVRGSKALDLTTGDRYIMNSAGTWVQQPSEFALDLAGYATETWVQSELTAYATITYVDTGLALKMDTSSFQTFLGIDSYIAANTDLNTIVDDGVFQILTSALAATLNLPTECKVAGSVEVLHLNGNARMQIYRPNWASSGSVPGAYYIRQRTGASVWTGWYRYDGTAI